MRARHSDAVPAFSKLPLVMVPEPVTSPSVVQPPARAVQARGEFAEPVTASCSLFYL
jgi:hypothetical protein